MIPAQEIDTIIDNIGIPNGGFNLAFGDSPTLGVGDGDILISLNPRSTARPPNTPTSLRKGLREKFPDVVFFFEAANITNQILNFGLPAPIDVQVVGRNTGGQLRDRAADPAARSSVFPGAADVHIHQVVDYPEIRRQRGPQQGRAGRAHPARREHQPADLAERHGPDRADPVARLDHRGELLRDGADAAVPRRFAERAACGRRSAAPQNTVNTNTPTSLAGVANATNASVGAAPSQTSAAYGNPGSVAAGRNCWQTWRHVSRGAAPEIVNHYNVQPVFDVYREPRPARPGRGRRRRWKRSCSRCPAKLPRGTTIDVRGQIATMQSSFYRLGLG